MAETPYHAWTRTIIARQPELLGGVWVPGSPAAEIVVWTLSTPLGTFQPDPTLGVDYASVGAASPEAPARLAAAIAAALGYAVRDGSVAELAVTPSAVGAFLQADVAFVDPRDPTRTRQRRAVRV